MPPGRKPRASADKALDGNPGKRGLNQNEPKAVVGLPTCPKHLQGEARREWHRMGRKLKAEQRMALVYKAAFAIYCQAWGRWAEAEEKLAEFGLVITTKNGNLIQSPYLAIANKAMAQLQKALAELGISPSSQSRVSTVQGQGAKATTLELLQGGKLTEDQFDDDDDQTA